MRRAAFRVMMLKLLRDPAALAMSFVLPGIVFVIFALIFSGASGGELSVRLAIADERADAASRRFVEALLGEARMVRVLTTPESGGAVRAAVRSGEADAGLVVRRSGRPLDDLGSEGAAPIEVVSNPAREIASTMLQGAIQKAYFAAVPEAALRSVAELLDRRITPFDAEQRLRIEQSLETMRTRKAADGQAGLRLDRLTERNDVLSAGKAPLAVTYYAGAVAMLFLLFSALTGAMSHLDERESGLIDRLAIGPGGVGVLLDGKFAFLLLQGVLQVAVIYVVAWLAFGVELPEHWRAWAITTLAAALAAAGLMLAFVTLCRSRAQAQTLGQMLILIVSAIGGSMVPRYLMPDYVQSLGWATPNTWALEAYGATFTRNEPVASLVAPWVVLGALGLGGLIMAHVVARRSV
jgi:ABC-2 type transport system permease protein